MSGLPSGTLPDNPLFRSKAQLLISDTYPTKTAASNEKIVEQGSTSEDKLTAPQPPIEHAEIWWLIAMLFSTPSEFKNFSLTTTIFFNIACEVLYKKLRPRSMDGNVEPSPSVAEIAALLQLPHSTRANRAFNSANETEYALPHNRLFREWFSQACLHPPKSKLPPFRGSFLEIANVYLSNKRDLKFQNLIDIKFLNPQTVAGADLNSRISQEHATRFFNNMGALGRQKTIPITGDFLVIEPKTVREGITEETGNEDIALIFRSKAFINTLDENGQPDLQHLFSFAAANNRLEWFKERVEEGLSVDPSSEGIVTGLHVAAWEGKKILIKYLLENGASIEKRDELGVTPFLYIVGEQPVDIIKFFVETYNHVLNQSASGTLLKQRVGKDGFYAVEIAAQHNDTAKVEYLAALVKEAFAKEVDPVAREIQYESLGGASNFAVEFSNIPMLESLVTYGADLTYRWVDEKGKEYTLMHTAIKSGDIAMLRFLAPRLESLFNTHANSLLNVAASRNNLEIWEFVKEKCKKVFEGDEVRVRKIKKGLLKTAIYRFSTNIVEALLKESPTLANRSAKEATITPLHNAIDARAITPARAAEQLKIVEILLRYGAKIDVFHGKVSPLTGTVLQKLPDIARLLASGVEQRYQHPALSDEEKRYRQEHLRSAIHLAAVENQAEIFDILVDSPDFDRSCSEENFALLIKVAANAADLMEKYALNQYGLVSQLVSKLENQSHTGASAVLRLAIQDGHTNIVKIFYDNPNFDWSDYEEIEAQLEPHPAIVQMFAKPGVKADSDATESAPDSSDKTFFKYA